MTHCGSETTRVPRVSCSFLMLDPRCLLLISRPLLILSALPRCHRRGVTTQPTTQHHHHRQQQQQATHQKRRSQDAIPRHHRRVDHLMQQQHFLANSIPQTTFAFNLEYAPLNLPEVGQPRQLDVLDLHRPKFGDGWEPHAAGCCGLACVQRDEVRGRKEHRTRKSQAAGRGRGRRTEGRRSRKHIAPTLSSSEPRYNRHEQYLCRLESTQTKFKVYLHVVYVVV